MIHVSCEQLCDLLNHRVAKYNSQNSVDRHYILTYIPRDDKRTFDVTNETFENSQKQGESHAVCVVNDDGSMTVHYSDVFVSPHETSPFHPKNAFYTRLFSGYSIGPLYTTGVCDETYVIPLMYNAEDGRVKTLFFYKKSA